MKQEKLKKTVKLMRDQALELSKRGAVHETDKPHVNGSNLANYRIVESYPF